MKKSFLILAAAFLVSHSIVSGQCAIEITSITEAGLGSPPPAVNILVSGLVKNGGCSEVKITLCCKNNVTNQHCDTQTVHVNPDNSWSTLFKNFLCSCNANSFDVTADASCASNTGCIPAHKLASISCQSPPAPCPSITNVTATVGNCIDEPSGCKKREVTFTPTISGTCDGYDWSFGDGSGNLAGLHNPGPVPYDYPHYPQTNPVLTIFKAGCTPVSFSITVPPFTECHDCPVPGAIDLSQVTATKCVLGGRVAANFCTEQYTSFIIDYGDGMSETLDIHQLNGLVINHSYPNNGQYAFQIILLQSGANCPFMKTITISDCNCTNCPPGSGGSGGCGWKFWKCLCGILAFFVGLWVATRLILLALGWSLTLPIGSFSWADILDAIGLGLAIVVAIHCPCDTAKMMIAGAAAGIATIIGMLIAGVSLPKWIEAIVVGLSLIAVMTIYILKAGC